MSFSISRSDIGFSSNPPIGGDSLEGTGSASEQVTPEKKELDQAILDKFKKDLSYFLNNDADTQEIIKRLLKITPKDIELQQVVDLIFEHASTYSISPLIDSIHLTYSNFTFSPHHQICKAIVEDKKHLLTNSSLNAMLSEHDLTTDEEKIATCYNLAYRMNHPGIYPVARTPIPPSDYTLNFLWVNLDPQDRIHNLAENIFGNGLNPSENAEYIKDPHELRRLERDEHSLEEDISKEWRNIEKSFTYRISKWADVNPNAQINLWYDSALVTAKAQQKTFEMIRAISESRGVNLQLRDIRRLPNIEGEIEYSLHPGTPVYFRIDILKALIADHMIGSPEESSKYCVVSDIDVEPMTPERLFDQRTLDYLSCNGYVFNRVGFSNFENSFFIFNKEKENLKKKHRMTLIEQTASIITMNRQYDIDTRIRDEYILDSHFVFRQYSYFLQKMKEPMRDTNLKNPRKVAKCPISQFFGGGFFRESAYQKEEFRFVGIDNIPYTRNGRTYDKYRGYEGQIEELKSWKSEPLDSPK